jgi:hypothetical protein
MSTYGYEIVQTLIVDIEPDDRVKRAMNEINAGEYFTLQFSSYYKHCIRLNWQYRIWPFAKPSVSTNYID